jgi:hypothetical protein
MRVYNGKRFGLGQGSPATSKRRTANYPSKHVEQALGLNDRDVFTEEAGADAYEACLALVRHTESFDCRWISGLLDGQNQSTAAFGRSDGAANFGNKLLSDSSQHSAKPNPRSGSKHPSTASEREIGLPGFRLRVRQLTYVTGTSGPLTRMAYCPGVKFDSMTPSVSIRDWRARLLMSIVYRVWGMSSLNSGCASDSWRRMAMP